MRFLDACHRRPTDATPIWMMRQAGRSLPAYRTLRERHGFLDLIEHPDLMAEVSLMPLAEYPADAVVMFADIMLPLRARGIAFRIVESIGPIVDEPIASLAQIDRLPVHPVAEAVPTVLEAIRLVRKETAVPVIGFSAAPFTLASYVVEGRPTRDFARTKRMLHADPAAWDALMSSLSDLIIEYLAEQIAAGAQAVQLFDSWIGALGPADANAAALPYTARIVEAVRRLDVPVILFGTGTAGLLEPLAATGPDVIGLDWRLPLHAAWDRVGDCGVQGNLDPGVLLAPPEIVRARAQGILREANARPGHIFNLGHGVLPETPLDALKLLVDTVHEGVAA